jgi:hypothetical protein
MSHFAYLRPVGPFAGLSNAARQKISECFPALSITKIESAAATFLAELEASTTEPRLAEARQELSIFAKELGRFCSALNRIRQHGLDRAIGEASRMICGENQLEDAELSLKNLRVAIQQTSRALPFDRAELASRRLIANLAVQARQAGISLNRTPIDSLLGLAELIFEDLMIGGDAASAVMDWHKRQAAESDDRRATTLLDLVGL